LKTQHAKKSYVILLPNILLKTVLLFSFKRQQYVPWFISKLLFELFQCLIQFILCHQVTSVMT